MKTDKEIKQDFFEHELKVERGKRSRRQGSDFEKRVRKDWESKGWIVCKWQNNVDLELNKNVQAKQGKWRGLLNGFPDFMVYKENKEWQGIKYNSIPYEIIFIECKSNGILNKIEKEKAKWYLDNNYCSKFLIAKRLQEETGRKIIKIEYKEFK